ncbi:hypothetical protein ACLFKX_16310, partial [Enterobacter hormaechei]
CHLTGSVPADVRPGCDGWVTVFAFIVKRFRVYRAPLRATACDRDLVVTAYQSASGIVNLITPTSAVVMGGLAIARVPYVRYLKWVAPLLGILTVVIMVALSLGALL